MHVFHGSLSSRVGHTHAQSPAPHVVSHEQAVYSCVSVLKVIKLVFYSLSFSSHHGNTVSSCVYSHHDRYLCTCSWDKCVRVFDIATGAYRWGAGVGGWGPGVR